MCDSAQTDHATMCVCDSQCVETKVNSLHETYKLLHLLELSGKVTLDARQLCFLGAHNLNLLDVFVTICYESSKLEFNNQLCYNISLNMNGNPISDYGNDEDQFVPFYEMNVAMFDFYCKNIDKDEGVITLFHFMSFGLLKSMCCSKFTTSLLSIQEVHVDELS